MRRILTIVLCLAVASSLAASPASARSRRPDTRRYGPDRLCPYRWWRGAHRTSMWGTRRLVVCFSRRFGVSEETALRVADRESSFYPYASSPSGAYRGVYQEGSSEFSSWWYAVPHHRAYVSHRLGKGARFNARANIVAALFYVHRYGWGSHCHPWCTYP